MQSGAIPCNIKDEEAWPTALWTGYDVNQDEERMVNGEAGDLEPDIKPPVVKGLEGESADETGDDVKVTELKGTLLKDIGAKRDNEEERTRRKRRLESIQLDWEEEEAGEMETKKEHPVKIENDWKDFAKSGPWRFNLPPDDHTKDFQQIQHVVRWISGLDSELYL